MSRNVFLDLGFSDVEAANLRRRSYLLMYLQNFLADSGMGQKEIAKALGVDQPKVSKLLNGKIDEFSLERLIGYLEILGKEVTFTVKTAKHKSISKGKSISASIPKKLATKAYASKRRTSAPSEAIHA